MTMFTGSIHLKSKKWLKPIVFLFVILLIVFLYNDYLNGEIIIDEDILSDPRFMRLYENFDRLLATEGFYIDQNYGPNAIFINRRIIDTGTISEIKIGLKACPDSLEDFPKPKVLYAEYKRNGLGYWFRGWGPVSETEEYVIIETHNVVIEMSTFARGKGTSEPYNKMLSYILNLCE